MRACSGIDVVGGELVIDAERTASLLYTNRIGKVPNVIVAQAALSEAGKLIVL